MGERKVLNKYVPPDFDPSLVPRSKKPKDGQVSVRMMLPFSIQCSTCSTFMYRGRKFNSKKEPVEGPNGKYLGIQRYRFYIKCTACSRPVTFLTDPQHADYEMESGATRNYEVYKDRDRTEQAEAALQQMEEKEDPMRALENRVLESQREMQDLDNLEEIKAMNMRHVQLLSSKSKNVGDGGGNGFFGEEAKAVLMAREANSATAAGAANDSNNEETLNQDGLTESEEALVKSIKFGTQPQTLSTGSAAKVVEGGDVNSIRRLDESDERKMEERRQKETELLEQQLKTMSSRANSGAETKRNNNNKNPSIVPVIKAKKRKRVGAQDVSADARRPKSKDAKKNDEGNGNNTVSGSTGLSGLLGGYGSSDSDSD